MSLKNKLPSVLASILLIFSFQSFAGISIEPLGGYNWVTKFNDEDGEDYEWGGGYAYGGKLGYEKDKNQGFSSGLEYLISSTNMSNNDIDKNINTEELGLYIGYKMPALFKFYGEFIFAASGDTEINDRDRNLSSGMGWKLGVGSTIIPFIDLNFDYRTIYFENFDYDAFMFSASWPIHLFE